MYFKEEQPLDSDVADDRLYLYDKKTGKSTFLLEVRDVHCSKADICVLNNKVYYAYGHMTDGTEYNSLLEVDLEPEDEDLDSPWEIAKKGDYYIIHTLNSRNLIFDVKGKEAVKAAVPEQLGSKDLTYSSALIKNISQGRYLYFQQVLENSVYVFDSQTGKFGHFGIKADGEIWNMMRNDKNQLLFEVLRADDKTDYIIHNKDMEL